MAEIKIKDISKTFNQHKALDSIDLTVQKGEMVALIGSSGSGKSTLLRIISGLVLPNVNDGSVELFDTILQCKGKAAKKSRILRSKTGFIFQKFNLVGRLSLFTNILIGLVSQVPLWRSILFFFTKTEKMAAFAALESVGLGQFAWQRADTLSGGQQQRGSIARAIVQNAEIILADEPVASLDPESARSVMSLLYNLNKNNKITILVSLHQIEFAMNYCSRIIALKNGKIVFDGTPELLTEQKIKEIYDSSNIPTNCS